MEISQILPNNTKRYTIKARNGKSKVKLAFSSGDTINNYISIERGFIWDSHAVDVPNGHTIYLNTTVDDVDIEFNIWTRN